MKKLTLLLSTVTIIVIGTSCNKPIKVTGVVSYFYNKNFGQMPDAGAEIYFIEESNVLKPTMQWSFTKLSPNHMTNRVKVAQWGINKTMNRMTEQAYIDSVMAIELREADDRNNAIFYFSSLSHLSCTANGNGEFSIDLPKGKYYTLVVYSHREGIEVSSFAQSLNKDTQLNYQFTETDLNM